VNDGRARVHGWRDSIGAAVMVDGYRRWIALAIVVSFGYLIVQRTLVAPASYYDFKVYRAEGMLERHNDDLYQLIPYPRTYATYPPFAALCFVPVTFVPIVVGEFLSVLVNLGFVFVVCALSFRFVFGRRDQVWTIRAVLVSAGIAIWAEPVYTTFGYGQVNLALLALILWDLTRPDSHRYKGIGIGVAAGLKVTPGIFIVYLILTRRFRAAATAIAAFAGTVAVSAIFDAHGTWDYWAKYLFDSSRVGRLENAANQTTRGFLTRLLHTTETRPVELVVAALVLVVGLAIAVAGSRRLGEPWGACACAVTGMLVSPISWSHHWVWCIPIGVLLVSRSRVWAVVCIAVFCSFVIWYVPHENGVELRFARWQILLSGWYVYFGIAFLAGTGWRTWHRPVPADGSDARPALRALQRLDHR
jgi:alpha-1,2-mannosyltransferase